MLEVLDWGLASLSLLGYGQNFAWTFPEVLIMLRSVKAQIQGLSKSQISSDKLVPGGLVGWSGSGFSKDKVWLRLSQPIFRVRRWDGGLQFLT